MRGGARRVVVGQIVAKDRHPEADKLWVTRVDVGADEPLQIVCGAQNFEAGDKVPVALVGATLPNGMTIKKAKLRGVESRGMNCSAKELGLGEDHAGLIILPADAPVGMPFAEYRRPVRHRPRTRDHAQPPRLPFGRGRGPRGRRRLGRAPHRCPRPRLPRPARRSPTRSPSPSTTPSCARATPRDSSATCTIGPSPAWLAERVTASGARSISNVVDITNYVMFELGQPLHAFDADLLAKDASGAHRDRCAPAAAGEKLTTLDGQERTLTADTLLITDPSGPVALAGVMGGESTEVHDGTVNVLLESACFNPASISRTSRRLGLFSEASSRFEKGVDRMSCVAALDRAAALMAELCGGEVAPGVIDTYPAPAEKRVLTLRLARLAAIVGAEIAAAEADDILTRLGCEVSGNGDSSPCGADVSAGPRARDRPYRRSLAHLGDGARTRPPCRPVAVASASSPASSAGANASVRPCVPPASTRR